MTSSADVPRAVLVVALDGQPFIVAVDGDVPCDLGLVDRLLSLRLVAMRMGWTMRVEQVDDELADLLDLVGVGSSLGLRA